MNYNELNKILIDYFNLQIENIKQIKMDWCSEKKMPHLNRSNSVQQLACHGEITRIKLIFSFFREVLDKKKLAERKEGKRKSKKIRK